MAAVKVEARDGLQSSVMGNLPRNFEARIGSRSPAVVTWHQCGPPDTAQRVSLILTLNNISAFA
jgi:hypothetical protein